MGIYDQYEHIQLKVGDVCMADYHVGDKVPIADGVYIAPDGAVIIINGKFIMTTDNVQDKWGCPINVENQNPILGAVESVVNDKLRAENEQIKGFIQMALDELGIPTKDYPAPVANAVDFLREALRPTTQDKADIEEAEKALKKGKFIPVDELLKGKQDEKE